jgi:hypothetical protein
MLSTFDQTVEAIPPACFISDETKAPDLFDSEVASPYRGSFARLHQSHDFNSLECYRHPITSTNGREIEHRQSLVEKGDVEISMTGIARARLSYHKSFAAQDARNSFFRDVSSPGGVTADIGFRLHSFRLQIANYEATQ